MMLGGLRSRVKFYKETHRLLCERYHGVEQRTPWYSTLMDIRSIEETMHPTLGIHG